MLSEHPHFAYGDEWADLEAVMRFGAVKRWHMIDTTRQQTLAEHSACVAALAYLIACKSPAYFFGYPNAVAVAALVHDMAEVFTGDIPSHTKRELAGVQALENKTLPKVWQDAESAATDTNLLIKICDLADGIRFVRLHGVDITSQHAKSGLEAQLEAKYLVGRARWPIEISMLVERTTRFYAYEWS